MKLVGRVLALSPHTDDIELGCGGTVARLIEEGIEVFIAAFSTARDSLPEGKAPDTLRNEFIKAATVMGIPDGNRMVYDYPVRRLSYYRQEVLDNLVELCKTIQPDTVLLPSSKDMHQDHQVLHAEGMRAFKNHSILGYELPWNHVTFPAQAFVVLEERHLRKKWEVLLQYESQFEKARPYFSCEFVEGLARVRGTQVGALYAESFEVLRIRW